jgi:tyrosine-protein kinase Etk/Wzc
VQSPVNHKKQSIFSEKDLNFFLRILRKNWWVPLIVLPIFYGIGKFYLYRLPDIYKVSTEFLFKSNDTYYQGNVLSEASFYTAAVYTDNQNEQRILQSYDLANKVIDKLISKIGVSYFIIGKVLTTEDIDGMPFKIIADEAKVRALNRDLFERLYDFKITGPETFEISFDSTGGKKVFRRGNFNSDLPFRDLPIRVEKNFSVDILQSVANSFYQFQIHSKEYLIYELRENLKIENPDYTNILTLSLTDKLPERALLILDTLNSVYAQGKLKAKYELNDRTVDYIDRQLNEIKYSLQSFEDTMQTYKEDKSIIDLEWERSDFLSKISGYDNQKTQKQLELNALNDLEKYIIEDKDPQFLPPSVFVTEKAGFMIQAATDLYTKQIELNKLYNVGKDKNPHIIELRSSIKKTKQDLLVYINNTRKALQQQLAALNREILNYVNEARRIPGKQRDILNIQRNAKVSENLYNFLLEKKASTKIAKAGIISDLKIVEFPRVLGIVYPDKAKIRMQFLLFGALASFLLITIRLLLFTKIETVEHLKDLTNIPLIGVLPFTNKLVEEEIVVEQSPNSLIAEAFRNFRTNLRYTNVDVNAKTFLVTSFLPGEGKTFTSSNLAAILARSGKKTVLMELDLHKPRVYQRFGITQPTSGITSYITGNNSIEEIVSPTAVPNLSCIYSGPIPPNPSEFVLSEKMKELIQYAKENFDFVIIDTPPAGLLSDSVYLIQNADATIFVLNTKTATKKVINFVEDLVVDNNLKNINFLLNGVKHFGRRYHYKGYGYSYGYGYGYGYGKGKSYR